MKAWILRGSEMLRSKLWQIIVDESDTYATLRQAFHSIVTASLASPRILVSDPRLCCIVRAIETAWPAA